MTAQHPWLSRQRTVWLLALIAGILAAYAVLGFRAVLASMQFLFLGTLAEDVWTSTQTLPAWQIALAPVAGGLIVGLLLQFGLKRKRPFGVADLVEVRALHGGRVGFFPALQSALIAAISLGSGASAGREGPVVHLGGAMGAFFAQRIGFTPRLTRTLLAAGAASAVSASFNAPIAGVLFALEVVLGHYALSTLPPIVIASVAGTVVTRIHLGDYPAFQIPAHQLGSYLEMPAFIGLGLLAAVTSIIFLQTIILAEAFARRTPMPLWFRPVLGGALIGGIALYFPQVLGVGYEVTDAALKTSFPLWILPVLILAKIVATAITFASRFGGGIFSPSLYLGAMVGSAFGLAITILFPGGTADAGFYAMVGMGAVAAAMLGAPISTTLIVFELTGDYNITIALLVSASIATVAHQSVMGHSFFQWQLRRKGLDLRSGYQTVILHQVRVNQFMRPVRQVDDSQQATLPEVYLFPNYSLERALRMFENENLDCIPVIDRTGTTRIIGYAYLVDALRVYNDRLVQTHIEQNQ